MSDAAALPVLTAHGRTRPARWGAALPLAGVVAAVVVGASTHARTDLSPAAGVAMGLAVVWALAALVVPAPLQWLLSAGAVVSATTLAAQRLAIGGHTPARVVATLGGPLLAAISVHLLLAFPHGRVDSRGQRAVAVAAYATAVFLGLVLALASDPVPGGAFAAVWCIVVALVAPVLRGRYARSIGADRERMQWAGIGALVAADVALVAAVLHALVGWPEAIGAVAAAATAGLPLGIAAGCWPRVAPHGGRVFVQLLSIVGFTVVVSAIYLTVVLGLGHTPDSSADRDVLGLSMLAAAIAAVGYGPARDRLARSATRFVYGARQAPDDVLRTFGRRLTRAVSMDELLLQLAESLTKTMGLRSAEIYRGVGDVLERAASVPDVERRPVLLTGRERPIVARAGVSGQAWASVWLPLLMEGRDGSQVRVAPVSHAGDLLGLILVERGEVFSEDDDRVLADLAREVGLAFHNVQLDAALQTTLEELRKQAEDLRESRARIVASGDAERRKVERNLHDGAQQRLVALAVNLRLARDVVTDDPDAAAEMLDGLVSEVQETVQELRELAHGIYPPLLVDGGLMPALRAAATRSPLDVAVEGEVSRYPAEVEAAVYFCCLEALQNAAKHAEGATVEVTVKEEAGGLVFSVVDDGPGFDATVARRGHGYINMSDRVGAIGGTVRWDSSPGEGARIVGSVPLM
jgi:signal transduction histidine kinase